MSLRLKDGVLYVRRKLGELNQWYWDDDQIVDDLNWAARDMCSRAEALTKEQNLVLALGSIKQTGNIPNVATFVILPFSVAQFTITNQSGSTILYFSSTGPATAADIQIAPGNSYSYSGNPISEFSILGTAAVGTYYIQAANGLQEAALDPDLDLVKSVKYFMGQVYPLEPMDWQSLQVGAAVGSIPLYYYIKTSTRTLTPQSMGSSQIITIPIGPGNPTGETFREVMGVWPIPPSPGTLNVWYSYQHPWMSKPLDPCAIPDRFLKAWASYAVAESLDIEKAVPEADRRMGMFEAGCENYRIYMGKQRQADRPARYGRPQQPWRRNPSSSVVFIDPLSGQSQ